MSERGAFQFELSAKKRKRASLWSDSSGQAREAKGDLIEIGSLSTCSILLNDPVVQEVHCVVRLAAGTFSIEDRGSATGTYVNGLEVREPRELRHGDQIVVGVSRLSIALAGEDGTPLRTGDGRPLLRIALEENAFFFAPKTSALFKKRSEAERGTEEALATKDQWVYAETRFGRSRALFVANWIGGGAVVLLAPLFLWTALGEELVDPGALSTVHAAALAEGELGCAACHESFEGPTAERCEKCHPTILESSRHPPWKGGALASAAVQADCETCHRDHQGPEMLQPEAPETCDECHGSEKLEPDALRAALDRWDQRVERSARSARPQALDYNEFSHRTHLVEELGIECSDCHVLAAGDAPGRAREFQPVAFETCMKCHDAGSADALARWPGLAAYQWEVGWHGSDDPSKCLQCHERLHEGTLKSDETVEVDALAFTLQRRDHAEHFGLDSSGANRCIDCHASGTVPAVSIERAYFWHGLHMRDLEPEGAAEQARVSKDDCLACHTEVSESGSLASLSAQPYYAGSSSERCGTCHKDAQAVPLELALVPDPAGSPRTRTDFPHAAHLAVEGGCYACHSFELPAETLPFQARPKTEPDADCLRCHANHDHIAGGACDACHGFEDERWRAGPPEDPRMHSAFRGTPLLVDWTSGEQIAAGPDGESPASTGSSFDHFSVGHQESTKQGRCLECHAGRGEDLLAAAESILAVPIPLESDAGCRACHVIERRRFHWE